MMEETEKTEKKRDGVDRVDGEPTGVREEESGEKTDGQSTPLWSPPASPLGHIPLLLLPCACVTLRLQLLFLGSYLWCALH